MSGLLLVAHGSRVPEAAQQARSLRDLVAEQWDGPVGLGFLELAEPTAMDAGEALVAEVADEAGPGEVVVQPLLLLPGNHARFDVQTVGDHLAAGGVEVRVGRPVGTDVGVVDLAVRHVREAGPVDAMLVVASGTASDQALRALDTGAALVARGAGIEHVAAAPTSLDGSLPAEAWRALRDAGHRRIALLPWMLFPGRLEAAAVAACRAAAATDGGELVLVERFGPDPVVARALVAKARRATSLAG